MGPSRPDCAESPAPGNAPPIPPSGRDRPAPPRLRPSCRCSVGFVTHRFNPTASRTERPIRGTPPPEMLPAPFCPAVAAQCCQLDRFPVQESRKYRKKRMKMKIENCKLKIRIQPSDNFNFNKFYSG